MLPPDYYNWYVQGSVTLGIWAKRAGSWVFIGYDYVSVQQNVGDSGEQTVSWYWSGSYDLGPGVQAFGVTVEGFDGTNATVADLVSASWTATASSGERSATPSGQLSSVVVIPR